MDNCNLNKGCDKVYQPIQKPNFFRYTAKGSTKNTRLTVGSKKVSDFLGVSSVLDKKGVFNNAQIESKAHIICGIKMKSNSTSVFDIDPVIKSIHGDVTSEQAINLSSYETEFAYKQNIMTIPVKFVLDYRNCMVFDGLKDAETLTVTLNIEKVPNSILNI